MMHDFNRSSDQFLASIDAEIARLQTLREQVAAALGSDLKAPAVSQSKRKGMSEEGRRKIAEAQKARWAKQKSTVRTAPKPSLAKKTSAKKTPAKKVAAKKTASKKSIAKSAPAV